MVAIKGTHSPDHFHRELGKIIWEHCGMERSAESLDQALAEIPVLREQFWNDVRVLGDTESFNQSVEKAGRVADFLEFGEELVLDARRREESCGGHFRVEYQTEDGEALRNDDDFAHVAAWEWEGEGPVAPRHPAHGAVAAVNQGELNAWGAGRQVPTSPGNGTGSTANCRHQVGRPARSSYHRAGPCQRRTRHGSPSGC